MPDQELRVRSPLGRCPYCKDQVEVTERAACADCLAVHHRACWGEHGACSSCASTNVLLPPGAKVLSPEEESLAALAQARRRETQGDEPDEDLVDAPGAAVYLGIREGQLHRLVVQGRLPARVRGDTLRFRMDDLDALLRRVPNLESDSDSSLMGVEEACRRLDIDAEQLAQLVERGYLSARTAGDEVTFEPGDVESLRAYRLEEVVPPRDPSKRSYAIALGLVVVTAVLVLSVLASELDLLGPVLIGLSLLGLVLLWRLLDR